MPSPGRRFPRGHGAVDCDGDFNQSSGEKERPPAHPHPRFLTSLHASTHHFCIYIPGSPVTPSAGDARDIDIHHVPCQFCFGRPGHRSPRQGSSGWTVLQTGQDTAATARQVARHRPTAVDAPAHPRHIVGRATPTAHPRPIAGACRTTSARPPRPVAAGRTSACTLTRTGTVRVRQGLGPFRMPRLSTLIPSPPSSTACRLAMSVEPQNERTVPTLPAAPPIQPSTSTSLRR